MITSLSNNHIAGYTNIDVNYIYIHNQTLSSLPQNLSKVFPNLQGIEIQNSNFTTISKSDLKNFKGLKLFSSWFSDIQFLEENLFEFNLELQWIAFRQSNLKSVGGNLIPANFDSSKIVRADFRNNPCVNVNTVDPADTLRLLTVRLAEMCPAPITTTTAPTTAAPVITTEPTTEPTTVEITSTEPPTTPTIEPEITSTIEVTTEQITTTEITSTEPITEITTELPTIITDEPETTSTIAITTTTESPTTIPSTDEPTTPFPEDDDDVCPEECLKSIRLLADINDNLLKKVEILENEVENVRQELRDSIEEMKCKLYTTILSSTLSQCSAN